MSNPYTPFDPRSADPRFAHLPPPPGPRPTWAPPPPPFAPVQRDTRRIELSVRNLLLTLGVLSLVAAAISFIAMNWESFDVTMRASLLIGVSVMTMFATFVAAQRDLTGTSKALGWLTMVLFWIDVGAIERALPMAADPRVYWAAAGAVLFCVFALLAMVLEGWAMRLGAVGAWLCAWCAAFDLWRVEGTDVWILPFAAVISWLQWRGTAGNASADSWSRYGAGLILAAIPAVATTLVDPGLARPLTVVGTGLGVLLVGFVFRQLAAIWVAGISLGVIAVSQVFDALRGMPGWAVFTVVGVVLLAVGAGFERRLRPDVGDDDELADPDAPTVPSASPRGF